MQKALSVVIPTFNERENIQILVPRVLEVFARSGIDGEIIIVEDPSTDGSEEVLRALAATYSEVKVIFREPPGSLSRAWHEGFVASSKQNIVCIDADLCHDPAYFPGMLEKMGEYDIVIGSRYLAATGKVMKDKSPVAILCSKLGQYSTRFVFGFQETDTSHSFRMFRKEVFTRIADRLDEEGNVYLVQFLYEAKRVRARVGEIPIVYGKRIHGETKLKISRETLRYFRFLLRTVGRKLMRGH